PPLSAQRLAGATTGLRVLHDVPEGSDGYGQPVADLGEDVGAEVAPAQARDPAVGRLGMKDVLDRLS
ncbi:hypothetical protein, partial [Streptomyces drozdowiczii]|uniref:hypothetical protein n=1 Tax=Streptomyces drozdowiczii TaxID=202862 RepID=UPI0031EB4263